MEPSPTKNKTISTRFFVLAITMLMIGVIFGLLGALQYAIPGFLRDVFSFERVRPMHVTSVVFWIILAAMASVVVYLQEFNNTIIYSIKLFGIQFYLLLAAVISIFISYVVGRFGGKEYWEFPPIISIIILIAWILFLINFLKTIKGFKNKPVFVWMWLTGVLFFLFTFLESYLWLIPYFRNNVVNDMTIQWKANGSMVGSWNMLIYGSSIYLMDKISGNQKYSHSKIAYALFFLGLLNLLFNWGHHIYTLPTHGYIKHISYIVSMTELIILGRIIFQWRSNITVAKKHFHLLSYRFLAAADVWIFLNLFLAILMSIPVVNVYTHGTHITVAHVMGTTIGINTFLLLAFCFDIFKDKISLSSTSNKVLKISFWATNISFLFFWCTLILVGILKAKWQMNHTSVPFSSFMLSLRPLFYFFFFSGLCLSVGIILITMPILKAIKKSL
jgi:nitric oxide reductase subunit B